MAAASGIYRYWFDGTLTDISEPWRLTSGEQGWHLRGQRLDAECVLLQIEASGHGSRCREMTLHWRPQDAAAQATAHYRLEGQALWWCRHDSQRVQYQSLPDDCRLFPLLRVATGAVLLELAEAPRWLVLPSLRDPADRSDFLRPRLSQRRAEHRGLDVDGTQHWRYYGGEYGEAGCDCWLDAGGLLRRYHWESPQGIWTVALDTQDTGFSGWR